MSYVSGMLSTGLLAHMGSFWLQLLYPLFITVHLCVSARCCVSKMLQPRIRCVFPFQRGKQGMQLSAAAFSADPLWCFAGSGTLTSPAFPTFQVSRLAAIHRDQLPFQEQLFGTKTVYMENRLKLKTSYHYNFKTQ